MNPKHFSAILDLDGNISELITSRLLPKRSRERKQKVASMSGARLSKAKKSCSKKNLTVLPRYERVKVD